MNTQKNFDDWLHDRHDKWATPQPLIDEYVKKACGSNITRSDRLIVGQDNEVYDVTTDNTQDLIVRISHKDDPRFEAERWALDAARQAGVPTPKVLLVEPAQYGTNDVTFCVEEKLPGVPLDVAIKEGDRRTEAAIEMVGDILNKLHSVQVDGFGYLQPDGKGWPITFTSIMLDLNEQQTELSAAAKQWRVPAAWITQGLQLLNDNERLYDYHEPSLVHGDIGLPHILVDDGKVTGVIDMQECSGNHPVFDFVHWDAYWNDIVPTTKIMASYGNKDLFGGNYEPLFHLALLRQSLWMLMVHVDHENPHGITGFKDGIKRALRYFGHVG